VQCVGDKSKRLAGGVDLKSKRHAILAATVCLYQLHLLQAIGVHADCPVSPLNANSNERVQFRVEARSTNMPDHRYYEIDFITVILYFVYKTLPSLSVWVSRYDPNQ